MLIAYLNPYITFIGVEVGDECSIMRKLVLLRGNGDVSPIKAFGCHLKTVANFEK
jgi:hypothetical protein